VNLGNRVAGTGFSIACCLLLAALVLGSTGCGETEQVNAGGTVQEAARAWVEEARILERGLADAVVAHTAFTRQIAGKWDTDRSFMPRPAGDVRRRFQRLLAQARGLPKGSAEINAANATLVRGLSQSVKAYDEYLIGLKTGRFAHMEAGDKHWSRATLELSRVRPMLDDVVGKPTSAFERELRELTTTLRPVLSTQADRALVTNSDMIDALERGKWGVARMKSAAAGRQFRAIVRRLERVPEPRDPRLADFLDKTIEGYRLITAAFVDYDRGLPTRDNALLTAGDRKFQRGFKLTQKAAADLIQGTQRNPIE
jgi:hypothetical protein